MPANDLAIKAEALADYYEPTTTVHKTLKQCAQRIRELEEQLAQK